MGNFKIDGKEMPKPNIWHTKRNIMTKDAGRSVGSGAMIITYLGEVPETTWTYKYITQADYDVLYNAYIMDTILNKKMYHNLTTLDSNDGKVITYKFYTQNDFSAPLVQIRDGVRYYKDVTFTFIGVGGVR